MVLGSDSDANQERCQSGFTMRVPGVLRGNRLGIRIGHLERDSAKGLMKD
jgi:predicted RNA-binding protein with TRAM domain